MEKMQLNVGLIGFGGVAEVFHAPLIAAEPALRLTHVVERHRRRSKELYPEVIVLRDVQELWESDVDLVVILTPNHLHATMACQALEAGKHVVVDKPFTVTVEEAESVIAAARRNGRVVSVFHNRRWDGDFLTVKKLLEENRLGRLVEFESRFDRYRPSLKGGWREQMEPGSGVWYDLGSHLADQALLLFGPPSRVWGDLRVQRTRAEAVDFFEVVADYGDLRVTLKASCLAAEPKTRFLLRGEEGSYQKFGLDPQEGALKSGATPGGDGWGREPESSWGVLHRDAGSEPVPTLDGAYQTYYRDLALAVREGRDPPVTGEAARDVLKFLERAADSHKNGCWISW